MAAAIPLHVSAKFADTYLRLIVLFYENPQTWKTYQLRAVCRYFYDNILKHVVSLEPRLCSNYDTYLERFASKCKNLTSVDLFECWGVTDIGVKVLATNCENLTRVGLIGTGVSQEMKNKLKEKGINVN